MKPSTNYWVSVAVVATVCPLLWWAVGVLFHGALDYPLWAHTIGGTFGTWCGMAIGSTFANDRRDREEANREAEAAVKGAMQRADLTFTNPNHRRTRYRRPVEPCPRCGSREADMMQVSPTQWKLACRFCDFEVPAVLDASRPYTQDDVREEWRYRSHDQFGRTRP